MNWLVHYNPQIIIKNNDKIFGSFAKAISVVSEEYIQLRKIRKAKGGT